MYMDWFLRRGVVYLPTLGQTPNRVSVISEPVDVVPVSNTAELRLAFSRMIARGNPPVPHPPLHGPRVLVLPKYAGVKSQAAFERGLAFWRLSVAGGIYRIIGQRRRSDRGWEDDPDNVVAFPAGTQLDEVIDRAIVILQAVAAL